MAAKRRLSARIIDYKNTFGSEHGRRVLLDLMKAHFMMGTSFSKEPLEMALNEGERNVILRILSYLNIDHKNLEELIKEEANNE